jgi:predicted nucleic acid-binding protein
VTSGIDAMILIWALQGEGAKRGNPRQKDLAEMQARATILLDVLEESGSEIVVPTVMVSELLAPIEPRFHGAFIAEIQSRFFTPLFDIRAASLAAELRQFQKGLPKDPKTHRDIVKADTMIVATAKVAGATDFYSHDAGCRAMAAKAGMQPHDLPTCHTDMFKDVEIKKRFGLNP